MIQFVGGDMYELEIEGKPFSAKWEQVKASKTLLITILNEEQ
jgi:hypothetical protein